jgi:Rrf2 family protein
VLCLSKKTEYALVALAYMAGRGERVSSAREIAEAHGLPLPLLMKILKCMQHHDLLHSTRGVRGGYRLVADLDGTSLFDLVAMMECPDRPGAECGCMDHGADPMDRVKLNRSEPPQGPALALQYRLVEFLKNVKLSDLVTAGRQVDLPVLRLTAAAALAPNRRYTHAHSAD